MSANTIAAVAAKQNAPDLTRLVEWREDAYRIALRVGEAADAEDAVQDAYVRALRAGIPQRDDHGLRLWFFQIVVNAARDRARSDKSRRRREQESAMDATNGPDAAAELELREVIARAMQSLDAKQRSVLCLRYEQGLTFEEASQVLEVPAGSLRAYASLGLQRLREQLAPRGHVLSESTLCALLAAGLPLAIPATLATSVQAAASGGGGFSVAATGGIATGAKWIAAVVCAVLMAGLGWMGVVLLRPAPAPAQPAAAVAEPIPQPIPRQAPDLDSTGFPTEPAPIRVAPRAPEQLGPRKTEPMALPDRFEGTANLIEKAGSEHALRGTWRKVGEDLACQPQQYARLSVPYRPGEEYDLFLEFTRDSGVADINVMFPRNGRTLIFKMGAQGNTSFGFQSVPAETRWVKRPVALENGTRYGLILEVRRGSVSAFLNGELLMTEQIGAAPISEAAWSLPDQTRLGLGSWLVAARFHRLHVKTITGEASEVQADPAVAALNASAYWKESLDLLPAATVANGWTTINGAMSSDNRAFAKQDLGYEPPDEYDLRVEFTRVSGKHDVVLLLNQKGRQFCLKLGAWGNFIHALDSIEGRSAGHSPAAVHGELVNGKLHTVIASVRNDRVSVYLDGALVLLWPTDYSEFGIEGGWKLPDATHLGIGSYESATIFRRVQVRDVTGTGRLVETVAPKKPKVEDF